MLCTLLVAVLLDGLEAFAGDQEEAAIFDAFADEAHCGVGRLMGIDLIG